MPLEVASGYINKNEKTAKGMVWGGEKGLMAGMDYSSSIRCLVCYYNVFHNFFYILQISFIFKIYSN